MQRVYTTDADGMLRSEPAAQFIAIVDNDPRSLQSLCETVNQRCPQATVLWTQTDGTQTIRHCLNPDTTPDLLMLDLSLEGLQGADVCRRIRQRNDRLPILAMTSFSLQRYSEAMRMAGAQGLVSKNDDDKLVQAITELLDGRVQRGYESTRISHIRLINEPSATDRLTPREAEIITLLADDGLQYQQIAAIFHLSEATVRKHMQNIMKKLNVRTNYQAVSIWNSRAKH